jgi:hypothetical protein
MPVVGLSDVSLTVIVGLATAAGAAVGGLVSAWAALKVEDIRRRQDVTAEEEGARRAARAALRPVTVELIRMGAILESTTAEHDALTEELPTAAWGASEQILADTLPGEVWLPLAGAYGHAEITNAALRAKGGRLEGDHRGTLKEIHEARDTASNYMVKLEHVIEKHDERYAT